MKRKKITKMLALTMTVAILLSGCASDDVASEVTENFEDSVMTESSLAQEETVIPAEDVWESMDIEFSSGDLEVGYDETENTTIEFLDESEIVVSGGGVELADNVVAITAGGTYILSGSIAEGQVVVDVAQDENVQLVLNGVKMHCEKHAALYIEQAKKVFLTLAAGSENTLSGGEIYELASKDSDVDGVIFSREDMTINGSGTLCISTAYQHGIVSEKILSVTGGDLEITSAGHALDGKNCVKIKSGTFTLTAGEDGIHSGNEDSNKGYVYIEDGIFTINAVDDGIHADGHLLVDGGEILIAQSNEGMEGRTVTIRDGKIALKSEDDGINATASKEETTEALQGAGEEAANETKEEPVVFIRFMGGEVVVDANGDGIDSNGNLYMEEGNVCVYGPLSDGDAAIDYETAAVVTGGVMLASGSSGMSVGFGRQSTQCSFMYAFESAKLASETVTVSDSSGNTIIAWTPDKDYSCIVVTTPLLVKGYTYTVHAGEEQGEIELTDIVASNRGHQEMGGGPGGMPGNPPESLPEDMRFREGMKPPEGMERPARMPRPEEQTAK